MNASILLEDVSCPLGCPKRDEMVLVGRDLLHDLPGEFAVVRCCNCGLMRTNPRPSPDAIGFYYPENYGPYVGTRVRKPLKSEDVNVIKKILRPLLNRVFNFNTSPLPKMAPGRMLEIGCASGAFLHQMASQRWQVQGIEFSEKAAQTAAELGYFVHAGPLETAPKPDEPFDLIVGWMVLEHLHDPVSGLRKLREWASPDAWLALSVPDAGALEFRYFKDKWYALHLPNHLYHFTPHTMDLVLKASGWKLERIHHQRVLNNLIASMGYILCEKDYVKLGHKLINFPERGGRWHYTLYPLALLLSIFGQTGRMTVWAKVAE